MGDNVDEKKPATTAQEQGQEESVKNESQEREEMSPNNDTDNVAMMDEDPTRAKFINSGDSKVEIGNDGKGAGAGTNMYPAMTKAELMKYANDPFWVKLRWALFILFWLVWLAMLVVSIYIIVVAPKCYRPAPKEWWQKEPVYEVYAKSFKDSDGDGKGDLNGITSKVEYLASLGVGSVWISPVYPSPMKDHGYDVSNYVDIDPTFGDLQDFKDLLAKLQEHGLKLIMDFVPNHSSDQHDWFKKSVDREDPYTDYYVWVDGSPGNPPTNWKSVFNGSMWEYHPKRGQYYLHQFYKEQPDLNLRNPKVVEELKNVLRFWMDLGVDGFRIDAVPHFFEDEQYLNEQELIAQSDVYDAVEKKYTYNLPECLDLLREFRQVLDAETAEDETKPRIMMTEAYLDIPDLVKYYGQVLNNTFGDISHLPLNLKFLESFKTEEDLTALKLKETIDHYLGALPDKSNTWPNFNLANHDQSRPASRFGRQLAGAMQMVMMMLPGTPITYYGEEIGMTDTEMANPEDYRDPFRTPMQWDDSANAGFTSGTPWLPVNANHDEINVAAQDKPEVNSFLTAYRKLAELRTQPSVLFGSTHMIVRDDVFFLSRIRKGNPGYLTIVNFGDSPVSTNVTMSDALPNLGNKGIVEVRTTAKTEAKATSGEAVKFEEIKLKPKEAIVVNFVPNF